MAKCVKCGKSHSTWTSEMGTGLCRQCTAQLTTEPKKTRKALCKHCRREVSPEAEACPHCGQPDPASAEQQHVPDYLGKAWLVTAFCCWPLGIPAIVNATKARTRAQAGDYQGAMQAALTAKTFCWWSLGVGLGGIGLFLLGSIMSAVAGS